MPKARLPTYFLSHGGGPWPYMEGHFRRQFDKLEASLKALPGELGTTPQAVLVISGHWEAPDFTVMSSPKPPMVYDYSGFPPHTYTVTYGAPGSPALAARVKGLLEKAGLPARLDPQRGFDHGTFSRSASFGCSSRAMLSAPVPGVNGTTMAMVLDGKLCGCA